MIRLVDSLSHPTITGDWLNRNIDSTFETLSNELEKNNFMFGFAVGIDSIEEYNHQDFILRCNQFENLYPIAGINPNSNDLENEIKLIDNLGFYGIKIHPRFSRIDYKSNNLDQVFNLAGKYNLTVYYCTYAHCGMGNYPNEDPFYKLASLINNNINTRIILVHGGDVEILKYSELVRHNSNTLLDLSLTFMKYAGSSIDRDIEYLFNSFDQRICIGTDHPEYSHSEVNKRFNEYCKGLSIRKTKNIASSNIIDFVIKPRSRRN